MQNCMIDNDIISSLRNLRVEKEKIRQRNDIIISIIKRYDRDPSLINNEIYNELYQFVSELSSIKEKNDISVILLIHTVLLRYAHNVNDDNLVIRHLFNCGVCTYILCRYIPTSKNEYFLEVASFKNKYNYLNNESKDYLLKVFCNLHFLSPEQPKEKLLKTKELMNYLHDSKITQNDKIDYDSLLFIVHSNIMKQVSILIAADKLSDDVINFVLDSLSVSIKLLDLNDKTRIHFSKIYHLSYEIIDAYKKNINILTILEKLDELLCLFADYSLYENVLHLFKISTIYIKILHSPKFNLSIGEKNVLVTKKIDFVMTVLSKIKDSNNSFLIDEAIMEFFMAIKDVASYKTLRKVFFRIALYRHKDNLIHAIGVSKISSAIFEYYIKKYPSDFIGMFGLESIEDVLCQQDIILSNLKEMCLLHDLGNFNCINIIKNTSRSLEKIEFDLIKDHCEYGYLLLNNTAKEYIQDATLFHHVWYNGQGGYPKIARKSLYKPLIDIISVADSIDAACDNIGRSFRRPKTLKELVLEFSLFINSRYSGKVINCLKDYNLYKKIEKIITVDKENAVKKVYEF